MHVAIFIFTIFAAWRWGDWKNWQKYHTTILYVAVANLLYNFIYYDHLLWQLKPPLLLNSHIIGELIYTFIVFPLSAIILLTNYPKDINGQVFRIIKFIIIYIVLEWILYKSGTIIYKNGWNIWWSLAWNFVMFPLWILHHKKPLTAYIVSMIFVILIIILFPISMS